MTSLSRDLLQLALRPSNPLQALLLENSTEQFHQCNLADLLVQSPVRAGAELDVRLERAAGINGFRIGELSRVTGAGDKGRKDLVTLVDADFAAVIFGDDVGAGGDLVQAKGTGHADALHSEAEEKSVTLGAGLLRGEDVEIVDVGSTFG